MQAPHLLSLPDELLCAIAVDEIIVKISRTCVRLATVTRDRRIALRQAFASACSQVSTYLFRPDAHFPLDRDWTLGVCTLKSDRSSEKDLTTVHFVRADLALTPASMPAVSYSTDEPPLPRTAFAWCACRGFHPAQFIVHMHYPEVEQPALANFPKGRWATSVTLHLPADRFRDLPNRFLRDLMLCFPEETYATICARYQEMTRDRPGPWLEPKPRNAALWRSVFRLLYHQKGW